MKRTKKQEKKYTVFIIDENVHRNFGFMTASRRHFDTIDEANAYIERNRTMLREYNKEHPEWTPWLNCYRIKNNETKEFTDIIETPLTSL